MFVQTSAKGLATRIDSVRLGGRLKQAPPHSGSNRRHRKGISGGARFPIGDNAVLPLARMRPQVFFETRAVLRRAQPCQIVGEFRPREFDLSLERVEIRAAHRMLRPPVPAGLELWVPPPC